MRIQLWINGWLHDEMEGAWTQADLVARMRLKWWSLIAKSEWQIFVIKKSRMGRFAPEQSQYTALANIEKVIPMKAA